MYKLFSEGAFLGYTEKLNYVKKADNGCYVATDEESAQGLAYNSKLYSLPWKKRFEGFPVVIYQEASIEEIVAQLNATTANLDYVMMMTDTAIPAVEEEVSTDAQPEV